MKNLALSLMALALIAGPAIAQEAQPLNNPPVQEERTNPDAPAITGDSGLTITGTVVSFTDSAVVLSSTAGDLTIQMTPQTARPATFTTGENLAIDYVRNSNGTMIATAIRPAGTMGTEVDHTLHAAPAPSVQVETQLQPAPEVEADVDADLDTDVEAEVDVDTDADTLPETGSETPLAGLIGLLALAAATALRTRKV
ncbi:MAG TPA: YabP/YqfC family sporulation protein [Thermoanaerobaculia bacterium]|nr:YabP/YqfC family sporulation protein [Thermoanaerobaculia bacterium]